LLETKLKQFMKQFKKYANEMHMPFKLP